MWEPVLVKNGEEDWYTSSGLKDQAFATPSPHATQASWVKHAAFGLPVVPEVKIQSASSRPDSVAVACNGSLASTSSQPA